MTIYAWPPVVLKSIPVWHRTDPVQVSRSILTGKRYASAHARRRIHAELSVSALYDRRGAGYMEALKRLLDGGVNFVRVGYVPATPATGRPNVVTWYGAGGVVSWVSASAPDELKWYTGIPGTGTLTTDGGFAAVIVTGLPVSQVVAIPGEFVRCGDETRMVIAEATSDANGTATIRVESAFTAGGTCTVGEPEFAVLEPVEIPRGGGPIDADYTYDWTFRQVFDDEIGTQTDVNPWF